MKLHGLTSKGELDKTNGKKETEEASRSDKVAKVRVIVVTCVGVMYLIICINQGRVAEALVNTIKYIIFLHVLQRICIHIEQV